MSARTRSRAGSKRGIRRVRVSAEDRADRTPAHAGADRGHVLGHALAYGVAGISVATGLVIAFVQFRHRIADFLGDVSYSVYLLHLPVGVTLIGWLSHLLPYSGSYLGVLDLVGMLASVGAAATLYRWVEKPAQEVSSRKRFVRENRREMALAAAGAE